MQIFLIAEGGSEKTIAAEFSVDISTLYAETSYIPLRLAEVQTVLATHVHAGKCFLMEISQDFFFLRVVEEGKPRRCSVTASIVQWSAASVTEFCLILQRTE